MDANGLRSFGLSLDAGLYPWRVPLPDGSQATATEPAPQHRVSGVRLASRQHGLRLVESFGTVAEVALQPALALDAAGNHVAWNGSALRSNSHLAEAHGLGPRDFMLPSEAQPVSDLAVGDDDVLYLAAGGALWLVDLRARFVLTRLAAPEGFTPQRLCAMPGGGVMALDVGRGALARTHGLPLTTRGVVVDPHAGDRFVAADPDPRRLRWQALRGRLPTDERAVALATHRHGQVVVLSLVRAQGGARLRLALGDGRLSLPLVVAGPRFAHTLGWLDGERIALATRGELREAGEGGRPRDPGVFPYAMPAAFLARWAEVSHEGATELPPPLGDALHPLGDYYPLAGWTGGPFVNTRPGEKLQYPRQGRHPEAPVVPARVARVSLARRSRYGVVANTVDGRVPGARVLASVGLIDTRDPGTVWHRLYAEAVVPTGCAMLVWLAAGGTAPPPFAPGEPGQRAHWYPHLLGERSALPPGVAAALPVDVPRAAWVPQASEVPQGQSLLCCKALRPSGPAELRPQAGLFTALIQRAGTTVRALQGDTLWVAVELFGDGRATPELVALRAYAGRVSYRNRYLPALYHERVFGEDADRPGRATGADFLERSLHLFEGLFTDIEDRIAASALMTDAMACPPEALPWLASWVGLAMSEGLPTERRRWMLANAPQLARRHGTLHGMQLALDIATDGAVTRGRLVVVEDFRLRRTLATILGARLEDATDPLTLGLSRSGNSVVGDALFLGDAKTLGESELKTFLALFRRIEGDAALLPERQAASRALFDELAHRVTVVVHEEASADEVRWVQHLAASSAPAHVRVRVLRAVYPFMAGVAALVGTDTYLRQEPPARPVRVGPGDEASALGSLDTLRGEASLDAHAGAFEGVLPPLSERPVARITSPDLNLGADATVDPVNPFRLDGSGSTAGPDREVIEYRWTHHPPLN